MKSTKCHRQKGAHVPLVEGRASHGLAAAGLCCASRCGYRLQGVGEAATLLSLPHEGGGERRPGRADLSDAGPARDAPGAALVDARPTASVGGAATAFDFLAMQAQPGRSEGERGSGATSSGGRSRRKVSARIDRRDWCLDERKVLLNLLRFLPCRQTRKPVWKVIRSELFAPSQGRCSTSCASCHPPPNMAAPTPMCCAMLNMYVFHCIAMRYMLYAI